MGVLFVVKVHKDKAEQVKQLFRDNKLIFSNVAKDVTSITTSNRYIYDAMKKLLVHNEIFFEVELK